MKKRGQMIGQVIKYILIALVIIMIQFIGYKAFTTIREKQCQTELVKFEVDLKDLHKTIEFGAVDERNYNTPCDVDEIYFVDLDKDISLDIFNKLPIIKDSLRAKVQKNVFLVKDNKLMKSFYAGNLEFDYPNYACLIPFSDNINFFLEGMGLKAKIIPGCSQLECTNIPINITEQEARSILAEIINTADCEYCPYSLEEEFLDFKTALRNANIFRKFKYCADTGITNVEIIIKPKKGTKLRNFRFYELIPKECIEDLNQYLAETIEGEVYIKADPLIVWQFDEINKETVIDYKLNTKLTTNCKKIIEGLAVAELAQGALEGENQAPVIRELSDIEFDEDKKYKIDLGSYVKDPDNIDRYLIWSFLGNNKINVEIDRQNMAIFTPENNWNGKEEITFTVMDPGGLSDYDTIIVTVNPINDAPVIEALPDQNLKGGPPKEYTNLFKLSDYAYDIDRDGLDYEIVSQTNPEIVECSLYWMFGTKLKCKVKKNEDGFSDITIQVSDGFLTDTDIFRVNIQYTAPAPYCGDGVCSNGETCSTCQQDCGACIIMTKLRCTKLAESDCVHNFDDECDDHSRGWRTGRCGFWRNKDRYVCYDDWETPCMENPTCEGGAVVETITCS